MEGSCNRSVWRTTIPAAMANYIDAGSIVAGSAGLMLWAEYLKMSDWRIGLIAAFSSNAISAAVGALIGGWICDKYGRKIVYTYDMLFYMFGMLFIIFSHSYVTLFIGYVIVGLSVGADIPASWTFIAEEAPAEQRAKHCGTAQLAWAIGPVVTLLLSFALTDLGLLGSRIVFAHLLVLAFITWKLRRSLSESKIWKDEKEGEKILAEKGVEAKSSFKEFFIIPNLKAMLFLIGIYLFWNMVAGTMGFLMPFIYQTVGGVTQAQAVILQAFLFTCTALSTYFIFMKYADKMNRRLLYAIAAIAAIFAWGLFVVAPVTVVILLIFVIIYGLHCGIGQQAFYQLWASEIFPTKYRARSQGIMFFFVRVSCGVWTFLVPHLISAKGFSFVASLMVIFLIISAIIGVIFAPDTSGKTLKQIEHERYEKYKNIHLGLEEIK
ncbi:MAG TPA: MFS transporter [Lentisphaeria bacterium]|nr:MAG: MFS transporter [Lentisphaerae bacterium GWF2_38_69]HBM16665.1 MFS transporter [Lentisphaeria bacterium]